MRSTVDARFLEERERFRFRHACEDCMHFDEAAAACSHGFPTEDHRRAKTASARPGDPVVFCKEWEAR
jgi:hypothetical protein